MRFADALRVVDYWKMGGMWSVTFWISVYDVGGGGSVRNRSGKGRNRPVECNEQTNVSVLAAVGVRRRGEEKGDK